MAPEITRAQEPPCLTGVHPKKTEGADIHNAISVDQILAKEFGRQTPLP